MVRFLVLVSLFSMSAMGDEAGEYSRLGRFGIRAGAGAALYAGGIDYTSNRTAADDARITIPSSDSRSVPDYTKYLSAGWTVPFQIEMTYGLSNAFELLLGFRGNVSNAFQGNDKYIMQSVGAALGYRYYFNDRDPIQAYLSGQLGLDLNQFLRMEGKSSFGFLFVINNLVGVFTEGNLSVAGIYNSDSSIGKGAQLGVGLSAGLHLHF